MCRMMGLVGRVEEAELLRFQGLAATGKGPGNDGPGHRDGWGIVTGPELAYAGRSVADAAGDSAFATAARRAHGAKVAVAHVRNASLGAKVLDNVHPFIGDGMAFCHNGTLHGIAAEGQSDSRAVFERIRSYASAGAAPAAALAAAARDVDAKHRYTSLTCLLTDGETLWGLRRIGNETAECGGRECALDFYTLGVARRGDMTIVAQEHELAGTPAWTSVPDGHLVTVNAKGYVSMERIL